MNDLTQMLRMQEGSGPCRNGRFYAYDDATGLELKPGDTLHGNLTIGYGHNITALGLKDVEMLLHEDIADAFDVVHHNFSCYDTLSRPRQLVLLSMAYNLGPKLSKWVRFIGAVHRGAWDEAAEEILDSAAAQTQAPSRYKELAVMMRDNTSQWV